MFLFGGLGPWVKFSCRLVASKQFTIFTNKWERNITCLYTLINLGHAKRECWYPLNTQFHDLFLLELHKALSSPTVYIRCHWLRLDSTSLLYQSQYSVPWLRSRTFPQDSNGYKLRRMIQITMHYITKSPAYNPVFNKPIHSLGVSDKNRVPTAMENLEKCNFPGSHGILLNSKTLISHPNGECEISITVISLVLKYLKQHPICAVTNQAPNFCKGKTRMNIYENTFLY